MICRLIWRISCHFCQKVIQRQKVHRTTFLKCLKLRGSALLSVCQPLTFVFFEACRSFVGFGAVDKWRSDFGSKLFKSFWVLYWPTSRQSSSDALWRYRRIFLATKTQLDLLLYLTWGRLWPLRFNPLYPSSSLKEGNTESSDESWEWSCCSIPPFLVLLVMHFHLWVCCYVPELLNRHT